MSEVKQKVDAINAAGSNMMLRISSCTRSMACHLHTKCLKVKTAIRTKLHPISLDYFYALLCSEELNIASDSTRELPAPFAADSPFALTAVRGRACGHGFPASGRSSFLSRCSSSPRPPLLVAVVAPVPQFNAYIASETATNVDWLLDTGASSHPTSSTTGFQSTQPYSGPAQVQVCNGQMIPIAHSGSGILATPDS